MILILMVMMILMGTPASGRGGGGVVFTGTPLLFTSLSHKLPTGVTFSGLSSRVSLGCLDEIDLITLVTLIFTPGGVFQQSVCLEGNSREKHKNSGRVSIWISSKKYGHFTSARYCWMFLVSYRPEKLKTSTGQCWREYWRKARKWARCGAWQV